MTVFFNKSRDRWQFDFWHRKERYAGYCVTPEGQPAKNKTEAKSCEEIEKGRVKKTGEQHHAPQVRAGETTLAQAFALFVTTHRGTPNWENARGHIRELLAFYGADMPASDISTKEMWRFVEHSRLQFIKIWVGGKLKPTGTAKDDRYWKLTDRLRADSTTNRYLATLGTALGMAHNTRDQAGKRLLIEVPDLPDLEENQYAPRPVPLHVLSDIVKEGPEHLSKAIVLTQLFGFRKMEALTVRTDQVDFDNNGIWLDGQDTKGKRFEFLPAAPEVMRMLRRWVAEAKAAGVKTLVYFVPMVRGDGRMAKGVKARSVKDVRKAWTSALKRHGLQGEFTFHNTKASFVTNVGRNSSGSTTQKWARHRNFATTQRYLEVADETKRAAAVNVAGDLRAAGFELPEHRTSPKPESQTAVVGTEAKRQKGLEIMVGTIGFEPTTLRPPVGGQARKVLNFRPLKK